MSRSCLCQGERELYAAALVNVRIVRAVEAVSLGGLSMAVGRGQVRVHVRAPGVKRLGRRSSEPLSTFRTPWCVSRV
eukprot:6177480-Pleurochrysis_carterae.AAC.2